MSILIAGGSGTIGQVLKDLLIKQGKTVGVLTRSASTHSNQSNATFQWNPGEGILPQSALEGVDTIINLCGAGIIDKPWSKARKKILIESRTKPLQTIGEALRKYPNSVKHIISASAIGYYGNTGEILLDENSPSTGKGFLQICCQAWESAAASLENVDRKVTIVRIGIVLDKKEGAYPKLVGPMQFGIMPLIDFGKPLYSWIHIDDLVGMFCYLNDKRLSGIYNGVGPQPVPIEQILNAYKKVNHSFCLPIGLPAFFLKLMMGEMSDSILYSVNVSSQKVEKTGFQFKYRDIISAVNALESHN